MAKKKTKKKKKGLYANIHAKRRRIKAGSKEKMRRPGSKGAPTKLILKELRQLKKRKEKEKIVARKSKKNLYVRLLKGKGANYRKTKSGAGMTAKGS